MRLEWLELPLSYRYWILNRMKVAFGVDDYQNENHRIDERFFTAYVELFYHHELLKGVAIYWKNVSRIYLDKFFITDRSHGYGRKIFQTFLSDKMDKNILWRTDTAERFYKKYNDQVKNRMLYNGQRYQSIGKWNWEYEDHYDLKLPRCFIY